MTLKYKSVVKFLLLFFLVDMFVFPALFSKTIPLVTEGTMILSLIVIFFDCIDQEKLWNQIINSIFPMIVYVMYAVACGFLFMLINDYDISLVIPAVEMIAIMIIVTYITLQDGNMDYIAFVGIILAGTLGVYTLFNLDTLIRSLNDRLALSGNMSSNTTGLLMFFGVLSTYIIKNKYINSYVKLFVNILCVVVIVLTSSRQSLLLVGIVYVFWLLRVLKNNQMLKGKIKWQSVVFMAVVLSLAIYAIYAGVLDQFFETKLFNRLNENNTATSVSDNARMNLYKLGFEEFFDSPILGCGYNDLSSYTHSTYTEVLGGTGMIGFVLFYFPIFNGFWKMMTKTKSLSENEKKVRTNILLMTILLFVMMIFRAVHYYIVSQILLTWVISGSYLINNSANKNSLLKK